MRSNVKLIVIVAGFVALGFVLWKVLGETDTAMTPAIPSSQEPQRHVKEVQTLAPPSDEVAPSLPAETAEASAKADPPREDKPAENVKARTGPGRIYGIVKAREGGYRVAGARITVELHDWKEYESPTPDAVHWEATSDDKGEFVLVRLPLGTYAGIACKENNADTLATTLTSAFPERDVTLLLKPCGPIAGTVRDEAGQAIEGATVLPYERGDDKRGMNTDAAKAMRVMTDAQGTFEIAYLTEPGWKLFAKAEGYAPLVSNVIAVGTRTAELVLKRGGSVSGKVVAGDTGQPVQDTKLTLSCSKVWADRRSVDPNENGQFEITGLADGFYNVAVEDTTRIIAGRAPTFTIRNGSQVENLEIKLTAGGLVTGRAYDAVTNQPLEGVEIGANGGGGGNLPARKATTDAEGNYRLEGLGAGQYTISRGPKTGYVGAGRQEKKTALVNLGETIEGLDFPLKPGLALRGRVVDTSGQPIPRAWVSSQEMVDNGQGQGAVVRSGEDGSFEHQGFAAGAKVTLGARKEGMAAEPVGPLTFSEKDIDDVRIIMDKGGSISGTVVDKAGRPQEDANVYAYVPSEARNRRMPPSRSGADGKGNFTVDGLLPGPYQVTANAGHQSQSGHYPQPVEVSRGQEVTGIRIVLEDATGLTIAGQVTNRAREPVVDASVYASEVNGNSNGSAQTDAQGRYTISGLQGGAHTVYVYHPEYTRAHTEGVAPGGKEVNFVLEGRGAIEGQVLDARTGRPISTFQVANFTGQTAVGAHWSQYSFVSFSDPQGRFRLDQIEEGDATTVFARAKDYAVASQTVTGVRAGQTVSGVVLRLETGSVVDGIVRNTAGQPVVGAQVYLGEAPEPWDRQLGALATTTASGEFRIDSLAADTQQITVTHTDYVASSIMITPEPGRSVSVEVVLGEGGIIQGTVRLSGKPSAGYHVSVYAPSSPRSSQMSAETDPSGFYSLRAVPAGDVMVSAGGQSEAGGSRRMERQAVVENGLTTTVDFDFNAGSGVIEGAITLNGQPLAQIHISVMSRDKRSFGATLGPDGHYRIDGLPAGAVTLQITFKPGESGRWQHRTVAMEVAARGVTRRDIELSGGTVVTGTVSGLRSGEQGVVAALRGEVAIPEFSMEVGMSLQDKIAGQAQVEPDGTYRLEGIEAGTYTLVAVAMDPAAGEDFTRTRFTTRTITVAGRGISDVNMTIP